MDYQKFSSLTAPSAPSYKSGMATGIPVNQPAYIGAEADWSSGLCGCCHDVSGCCLTCWCPCITFGRISDILDKGTSSCCVKGTIYGLLAYFTGCSCLFSCLYRSKLRREYRLTESPCGDCLVHCCCELCALCQEYRELKTRGFDMSIGWEGNMERQIRGVAMAPPVVGGGMRR